VENTDRISTLHQETLRQEPSGTALYSHYIPEINAIANLRPKPSPDALNIRGGSGTGGVGTFPSVLDTGRRCMGLKRVFQGPLGLYLTPQGLEANCRPVLLDTSSKDNSRLVPSDMFLQQQQREPTPMRKKENVINKQT
jgi:hypothetical protein